MRLQPASSWDPPLDPHRCAVLAGAGISFDPPACLPLGWHFTAALLQTLLPEGAGVEGLLRRTDPRTAELLPGAFLRFEGLLQRISEAMDSDLRVLDILDVGFGQGPGPNALHFGLARLLRQGVSVWTTNFDGLIESAATAMGNRLETRCHGATLAEPLPTGRVQPLNKIHGSFRDEAGQPIRETLKATLSTVGRMSIGLDEEVSEAFRRVLRERDLVVVGYSGLDDFDICSLIASTPSKRRLIWILHDAGEPRGPIPVEGGPANNPSAPRDQALLRAIRHGGVRPEGSVLVIHGRSDQAIASLWPGLCSPTSATSANQGCQEDRHSMEALTSWFQRWKAEVAEVNLPAAWLFAGILHDDLQDLEEAVRCWRRAAFLALAEGHWGVRAAAARNLIATLTDLGQLSTASRWAARLKDIERSRPEAATPIALAHSYNALARLDQSKARSDRLVRRVAERFEAGIHSARQAGDVSMQARLTLNLANHHLVRGATSEALRWSDRGMALARQAGDVRLVADALTDRARLEDRRGQHERAIILLEESRLLFARSGDLLGEFDVLLYRLEALAPQDVETGRIDEVLARAHQVLAALPFDYYRGVLARAEAELKRHRGDFAGARQLLRDGEAFMEQAQALDGVLSLQSARGFLEVDAEDLESARLHLESAERTSRDLGERLIRSDVVYKLAEIAWYEGSTGEADRLSAEALALNLEVGEPLWIVDALLLRASIIGELGGGVEARACLEEARRRFETLPPRTEQDHARLRSELERLEIAMEREGGC